MTASSVTRILVAACAALATAVAVAADGPPAGGPPMVVKHGPGPKPARLADGKPNWTGFWVPVGGLLEAYRGPSGVEGVPGGIAVNIPHVDPTAPEMKSPYKEQAAAMLAASARGEELSSKEALCFPPGMPKMMVMVYGVEILQTPNTIAMTSEWMAATRRVWMDLKTHPPEEELEDTYAGHSIGHWEKDTLVVDTVGVRDDVSYFYGLSLGHGKTHVIERFQQTAPDVLVDEVTLIDDTVFTKPWVKTYTYHYRPDLRIEEYETRPASYPPRLRGG
jgi:hypothetical protein